MSQSYPFQIPPVCDMTIIKTKSLQWFGAQQAACQPSPAQPFPGPSAWKWSPPVTPEDHSTPSCRSGCGAVLEQFSCSASELGAEPAGSPLGAAWLPFPANPHADTGRTSRLTRPAPAACNPESAVTGRQRHPGHRRTEEDGASAAQDAGTT